MTWFKNLFILLILVVIECKSEKYCKPSVTTASGTFAPKDPFCSGDLIFEDNFDNFDLAKWQHEITLTGGGGWEFQWYTNNRSNSFAKDGILHMRPTLTADHYGDENLYKMTLDLNGGNPAGSCTNPLRDGCSRTGTAQQIVNPIKSPRIRTVYSFNFKYGRVEVKAKLPAGDWLWPAIWLLPTTQAYGTHPTSGEIDVMESRGNKNLTQKGKNIGAEQIGSTLHWGPSSQFNAWKKSHYELNTPAGQGFDMDYHTYQVEWTPEFINMYVDNVLLGSVDPGNSFWEYGNFKNTGMENPWAGATKMAPFDQEFYLVMNLAVGGVSGYFPENVVNPKPKPWNNTSPTPMTDFWKKRADWLPTWNMDVNNGENSTFFVDYVRVWAL